MIATGLIPNAEISALSRAIAPFCPGGYIDGGLALLFSVSPVPRLNFQSRYKHYINDLVGIIWEKDDHLTASRRERHKIFMVHGNTPSIG
jgi:hypothetical protein